METNKRQKWIIDTDPGCDDMIALFYILNREEVEIEFISLVEGNCLIHDVQKNIKKVLKIINKQVKVISGCGHQYAKGCGNAYDYHFSDGLGNIDDIKQLNADSIEISPGYSPIEIIKAANRSPKEINLLLLGPLTNIVTAYMIDPSIVNKFKDIVVMGGTFNNRGNVLPSSEFNFAYDYIAAKIFRNNFSNLLITPWDPTEFLFFSTEDLANARDLAIKQYGGYNERVYHFLYLVIEKYTRKRTGTQICDLYAVIAYFNRSSVVKYYVGNYEVNIDSEASNGSVQLMNKRYPKEDYNFVMNEYYLKGEEYSKGNHIFVEEFNKKFIVEEFKVILKV